MNLYRPARSQNWYCWYYHPVTGKQLSFSCKTKLRKLANAYALERLREIKDGSKNSNSLQTELTLSQFAIEYLERCKGLGFTSKSLKAIDSSLRLLRQRIGDLPIDRVTVKHCQEFILINQPSVHTARKHYGHLRAAFERALERDEVTFNPFSKFAKPRAVTSELDILTEDDLNLLLSALPSNSYSQRAFARLVRLTFKTGLRLAEVRNLPFSALDAQRSLLYVTNSNSFRTKSGKSRAIPIDSSISDLILHQATELQVAGICSSLVFPNSIGGIQSEAWVSNRFRFLCREVFPDRIKLCFHSLRHSFATVPALRCVPVQELQKALGHSSVAVTERYTHLSRVEYPGFRRLRQ